jgi:hypothetical protein
MVIFLCRPHRCILYTIQLQPRFPYLTAALQTVLWIMGVR